jgi:hypothetical protein
MDYRARFLTFTAVISLSLAPAAFSQQPDGPQATAPAPIQQPQPVATPVSARPSKPITVPSGTRVGVVLENGISTRSAQPGDSVYLRTSFPITQNNQIIIPVGSYLRGELTETKRPGRVKGRGEFRMRLSTLILPNGYTVNLNAAPRSADSGGKDTMDSEGKVTSAGSKAKDAGTVAETTIAGAGIGAIAGGAKGAGIGAGAGGLVGLAAVLLSRGPEAELPRGSTMDVVLEHDLQLEAAQINYHDLGQALPPTPPPAPQQ